MEVAAVQVAAQVAAVKVAAEVAAVKVAAEVAAVKVAAVVMMRMTAGVEVASNGNSRPRRGKARASQGTARRQARGETRLAMTTPITTTTSSSRTTTICWPDSLPEQQTGGVAQTRSETGMQTLSMIAGIRRVGWKMS